MKKFTSILVLIVWALIGHAQTKNKAVFIILDGIPADAVERTETPSMDEVAAKGGYTRAWLGGLKGKYSQSPTVSAVGYNHLLTGTWTNKHNVHDNDIDAPNYNYWNIFRIAEHHNPKLQTAVFSSWTDNRTKLVGESVPAAGNVKLDYSYDGLELDTARFPHTSDRKFMHEIDESVSKEAARYIEEKGPDLSWVYLEFTDDMGHMFGDSPQFTDAIIKADKQVGRIWNAIRKREQENGETWMIVITTDHGRDAATGKNHGGHSDRERTTWITTNAPSLNDHFRNMPAVVDITPSILRFLNIPIPEEIANEMDGIPFVGDLSFTSLSAEREGNKAVLTWKPVKANEKLEILLTTTNNFKTGGKDRYTRIARVSASDAGYSFQLPPSTEGYYKILVKGKHNRMNTWLVEKTE